MASPNEKDDVPMLPVSDTSSSSRTRSFTSRSRSISLANNSSTIDVFDNTTGVLGYADPLGTQRLPPLIQMSDPLSSTRSPEIPFPLAAPEHKNSDDEMVSKNAHLLNNDPYYTNCPPGYNPKAAQISTPRVSGTSDSTVHNARNDDAKDWARRFFDKYSKWRTKIFVLSCLLSIFVDPLFFFSIEINEDHKCIRINGLVAYALVAVRSLTDLLFFVNMLLESRSAYVASESTVVGAGQLVDDPTKIASRNYKINLKDFCMMMPIPQIMILLVIPLTLGPSKAHNIKNSVRIVVLVQCIPKLFRLFPLLAGQRPTGFIFELAWANFAINLGTFILAGHVVGSFWYLFGLQRVNHCLRQACGDSSEHCKQLIVCSLQKGNGALDAWKKNTKAGACFEENGFPYGVYWKAVNLTHDPNPITRYTYSLFWGFQQISTLAGNQVPSYYFGDILFTMIIIGLGLFLFALLIGNIQNFLLGLSRRNLEMTLRRRDMNQWMKHRHIPEDIRKRVKEAERFNRTATKGFNEELPFENMPDDIQRDIRRHLFKYLKKVSIFSTMDESILDVIRERLKQKTYLKDSTVLHCGDLVKKIVFIRRGEMESTGEDNSLTPLFQGDVCGEELLTWCERSYPDGTRTKMPSKGLRSKRKVTCVTNVEAFSLSAADLEDVVSLFPPLEIPK